MPNKNAQDPLSTCYRMYDYDGAAFGEYGLKVDLKKKYSHGEMTEVGMIGVEDSWSAKVSVSMMPAHFWKFEIETHEGDKVVLETGSGSAMQYLPTVKLIGEDMITISKEA